MCLSAKRFLTFVAVLAVVAAVAPAMAVQLFSQDFTGGASGLVAGVTQGNENGTAASFLPAAQVGGATIYGVDGSAGSASGNAPDLFGWNYDTSSSPKSVDLVNNVMFAKISYVSDSWYSTGPAPASQYSFFCDFKGKVGATATTYFPTTIFSNSPTGYSPGQVFINNTGFANGNGIMIPYASNPSTPEVAADVASRLDRVLTNTFVWRNSLDGGKTLTSEVSGATGTAKATVQSGSAIAMTEFTGLVPTIVRIKPAADVMYSGLLYSGSSGQTNNAAFTTSSTSGPNDASKVKMGWTKFEVGETKPTDFNFDYHTTLADGQVWNNGRNAGLPAGTATMSQGDANNDGNVTLADGQLWNNARNAGGTYDTVSGNRQPLVRYDPATGRLSITADSGSINSIIVPVTDSSAYDLADVSMARSYLPASSTLGLKWKVVKEYGTLAYNDQTIFLDPPDTDTANLVSAFGDAWIATLPTGLGGSAFGAVSITFSDWASTVTAGVTIVPEPSTLCLLTIAGGAAALAAVARRRRAA